MQQEIINGTISSTLPSIMNIETIEEIAGEFKQLLSSSKISNLIIDASKVENITTAGLQLIVALEKNLSSSGGAFFIKDESDSFASAFKDIGLENFLSGRKRNG